MAPRKKREAFLWTAIACVFGGVLAVAFFIFEPSPAPGSSFGKDRRSPRPFSQVDGSGHPGESRGASPEPGEGGLPARRSLVSEKDAEKKKVFLEVAVMRKEKGVSVPAPGAVVSFQENWWRHSFFDKESMRADGAFIYGIPDFKAGPNRKFPTDERGRVVIDISGILPRIQQWKGFRIWTEKETEGTKFISEVREFGIDRKGSLKKWGVAPTKIVSPKVTLSIQPLGKLVLKAVDGAGRPVAGVPVGFGDAIFGVGIMGIRGRAGMSIYARGYTGKDGKKEFLVSRSRFLRKSGWGRLYGLLLFPMKGLQGAKKISPENFQGKPVVLRVPPTGAVEVRIKRNPARVGRRVYLRLEDVREAVGAGWRNLPLSGNFFLKRCRSTKGGVLLFPFVGLGLKLNILGLEEGVFYLRKKEIQGPRAPGEVIREVMDFSRGGPSVIVRMMDAEGMLLPKRKFDVFLGPKCGGRSPEMRKHIKSGIHWGVFLSNENGDIEVPLPFFFAKGEYPQIRIVPHEESGKEEWPPLCVVDLPPPFQEGTRFLGVHRLERPPLLVEGRVLAPEGSPVEGALVRCWYFIRRKGKRVLFFSSDARTVSREEGRFMIRGPWPWGEMRVEASMKGMGSSERVPAAPGARGVVLRLSGGGRLEGSLVLDQGWWLKRRLVRVGLYPKFDFEQRSMEVDKILRDDGSFEYRGLLPGEYEFRVYLGDWDKSSVFRAPGILVRKGRTSRPAVLQGIDLRGELEWFRIEPHDTGGKSLDPGDIYIKNLNFISDGTGRGIRFLKVKGSSPRVLVSCVGYESKVVTCKGESAKVILKKR